MFALRLAALGTAATGNADPYNCSSSCGPNYGNFSSSLPNVLLIGDSISADGSGYYENVKSLLNGLANVQHMGDYGKGICGTSFGVAACADSYLGLNDANSTKFNVIHFNWGLHDICPKMYAPVTEEQYVANMKEIYGKMKQALVPNGSLVWSSTTPVPPTYKNRNNSDVLRINKLMADLWQTDSKVLQNDLYSEVVQRCNLDSGIDYPEKTDCLVLQNNGVHFSDAGKQFTGIMSAAAIIPYL